jgi:gliding motility-associated-like protein
LFGCRDTVYNTFEIQNEFTFFAPTAFSPDNDAINDVFHVFGNGIDNNNFKLLVYNRWGEPIFESEDINKGWDGKVQNNKIAKTGSYTWICIYRDLNHIEHTETGSVTIVR